MSDGPRTESHVDVERLGLWPPTNSKPAIVVALQTIQSLDQTAWDHCWADLARIQSARARAIEQAERERQDGEEWMRFLADVAGTRGLLVGEPPADLEAPAMDLPHSTREAMISVLASDPAAEWTIDEIELFFAKHGRPISRNNVQLTLHRLRSEGAIRRIRRGVYGIS